MVSVCMESGSCCRVFCLCQWNGAMRMQWDSEVKDGMGQ